MPINVAKLIDAATLLETGCAPRYRVNRGDAGEIISKALMLLAVQPFEDVVEVMGKYEKKAKRAGITRDSIKELSKRAKGL